MPIQILDAWPFGGIWVLEQLWKELGLDAVLKHHAGAKRSTMVRLLDALFVVVVKRTLEPVSKLYCWEQWLREGQQCTLSPASETAPSGVRSMANASGPH
ncbi:MAG TPA: hypothetical protein VKP30_15875 [Polyangiaceae bacterium]|nr:hypothetical protein [Polyangiaceae bacterium]